MTNIVIGNIDNKKINSSLESTMTLAQKKREVLEAIARIEDALRTSNLKSITQECIYIRGIFS